MQLLKIEMTPKVELTNLLPMVENTKKDAIPIRHPEFAKRLIDAMDKEGVKASVTDIKKELKISYEMARRYTLGQAMPRAKKMDALAALVKESPSWLAYGKGGDTIRKVEDDFDVDAPNILAYITAKEAWLITQLRLASPTGAEFIKDAVESAEKLPAKLNNIIDLNKG